MFFVKYFAFDVVSIYENITLDIFHFLMSTSFLRVVYFFGNILKVMHYAGKASVTQGVIPRCTGIERAQTKLLLSTLKVYIGNRWHRMKPFSLGLQRPF
jgi:hypothetical protein